MSFLSRLFKRGKDDRPAPRPEAVPAPVIAPSTHEPEVRRLGPPMEAQRARAILESVLDDLGTAHHRPFSGG